MEKGPADECPSCGMGIPATAEKCGSCKAALGKCPGCRSWLVLDTECPDCEKIAVAVSPKVSTAVRKKAGPAPPESSIAYAYEGSAFGLLPLLGIRLVLSAVAVVALLLALVRSGVGFLAPVTEVLNAGSTGLPVLWGGFAVFSLGIGIVSTFVRRHRIRHTLIYGAPADYRPTAFRLAGNVVLNILFLALTAGLALPFLYARNRRSFYRNCVVPGHANRALDFESSSDEILGYSVLSLLLLPLVVASGGLLRPLLAWTWVKWEQNHLVIPGKFGQMQRLRLAGSFAGYFGTALLGSLLTLITAGLYRPWALTSEWRWIARNTEVR